MKGKSSVRTKAMFCGVCLLVGSMGTIASVGVNIPAAHASVDNGSQFVHPGMLYTKAALDSMREAVQSRKSPALEEWSQLQGNPLASLSYSPHFDSVVYRNAPSNAGNADLQQSSSAALMDAIEWYVTQNQAYANKAMQILNGWAFNLTSIQGHDAQLAASLYGYKLLNAAEIIRYSNAGWSESDINKFTSMMQTAFYSLTKTFGYVNGEWANGNWDAADILFNISYGVWSNNSSIYNQAVNYFKNGTGNGSVIHYIQDPTTGQVQESGRDQAHTQLGLGLLSDVAQIGWAQRSVNKNGADMYSYPNNSYRLLKGIEYTAKYNLGYSVPYTPIPGVGYTLAEMAQDSWLPGLTISSKDRGQFRPIYQQIYNFYHNDIGLPGSSLKYTKQVIDRMGGFEPFYYDEPSYGGLLDNQNQFAGPSQVARYSNTIVGLENTYELRHGGNHGAYIDVSNGSSSAVVDGTTPNLADEFEAQYLGVSNHFAFKSLLTGKYLTVSNDANHTLVASGTSVGPAQTFAIFDTGNGNSAIQSFLSNQYVTMNQTTGQLEANASGSGSYVHNDDARWYFLYPVSTPITTQSLSDAVTTFLSNGLIDSAGVANSLQQELKNNDLNSFKHHVSAQGNKHIDIAASEYLLRENQFLTDDGNGTN